MRRALPKNKKAIAQSRKCQQKTLALMAAGEEKEKAKAINQKWEKAWDSIVFFSKECREYLNAASHNGNAIWADRSRAILSQIEEIKNEKKAKADTLRSVKEYRHIAYFLLNWPQKESKPAPKKEEPKDLSDAQKAELADQLSEMLSNVSGEPESSPSEEEDIDSMFDF